MRSAGTHKINRGLMTQDQEELIRGIFQCTNCQSELIFNSATHELIDCLNGYLACSNCSTNTPIVNGIKYFTETDINYCENPLLNFEKLSQTLSDKRDEYFAFIKQKIAKGMVDPYSAFQPFNESSRSFYPFIEGLRKNVLEPGDIILDTWCRTGWTGYFLSSIFPDQKVISVWEGNKDVLGYQGFDYWFSYERKPKNLEIVFTDMNDRLPIKDNTIKLVYGLDTLHRYDQATMIQELLRVTTADGVIVWPHVHLTNSEPVPFFERGEKQLHGTDYDRFFQKRLNGTDKIGFVVSEPKMFEVDAVRTLVNTPDSEDYNALIGILPKRLKDFELRPYQFDSEDPARLFVMVNPYMKIDLCHSLVRVDRNYLNGVVGKMLDRHPIYQEKMGAADGYRLSDIQTKVLYLSSHNYSFSEMVNSLNIRDKDLMSELKMLANLEIVHVLPLDINAMNLQAFHSAQSPIEKASNHTLFHLRALSNISFQQQAVLVNSSDASELQNEDVTYLIRELQKRLQSAGIDKGDKIVIASKPHFEALLTFWGASEMCIEVCILSTEMPAKMKHKLIKSINPKLVLTSTLVYYEVVLELADIRVVAFDDENFTGSDESLFSSWLEESGQLSGESTSCVPAPETIAVTLFTSGTTGIPKGIQLSHGALYRSGELLSRTYGWTSNDKLLMVAELDSMSGLRNTCVATQFTGTTVVIPNFENGPHIFSIVESIKENQATLLTSTPALIKQLIQLGSRIKNELRSLRQVLCTGGNLSVSVVKEFQHLFGIRIINYYGLTETTGLCIGELENAPINVVGSIGVAIDTVAQVVDKELKILEPGEIGKLRVYNDRLMSGYLNPDEETNLHIENGWVYTGDWAVRDEAGNFFLKGRERDIIKDHAGNIVYLTEVEQCLTSHNKVKDVAICAEQNDAGEYLIAFIIVHDEFVTEKEVLRNELKEYVSSEIGLNKIPSQIFFKDEFKSNSRGKVDKKGLINSIHPTANIND